MKFALSLIAISCMLSGCADVEVQPITAASGPKPRVVYIQRNPTADQIAPELEGVIESGLQRHGIGTQLVDALPASESDFTLSYIATSGHDLKDFMKNAEIRLKQGSRQIGYAEYRSGGGLSVSKFGSVHDKIDPIMDQLLARFH